MKILMLSWEYPPRVVGGISRVVEELSKNFVKNNHEVTVVTYNQGDSLSYEKEESGVEVYRVNNYNIETNDFTSWVMQLNFQMITKVSSLINSGHKFDVIHAHDWLTVYCAKSIKEIYNIPIVSTIHATEAGRNSGIHSPMQRYINDTEWLLTYESSEVIVNSMYMKNEVERLFGLPNDKITVIPNGIDLTKFDNIQVTPEFRQKYAKDNEKIILAIGRLVFEKGIQHLLYAMPKILSKYNDCKLLIVGKGPMENELRAISKNLGIENKVYFTGYVNGNDVQRMYKISNIAVFPSTYEPFGIVALEGMLSNTPVVTSDIGGLDEIVSHKVNGLKSYSGNSNSIADSVLELLYNEELTKSVTKNALKDVKQKYNWDVIANSTFNTYKKAISNYKVLTKEELEEKELKDLKESSKNIDDLRIEDENTNVLTRLLNFNQKGRQLGFNNI